MPVAINLFKKALADRRFQLGLWLGLPHETTAELCGGAGFDWLLVDGEHAPFDMPTIANQLRALEASPSHAVVRPPIGEAWIIKQLLDIGAQTLLVPMVDTPEQAARMVAATRYPPAGIRGVAGGTRAGRWNRRPHYLQEANDEVCLLVQVETMTAIENLDGIVATEGVDGIFFGPADLSASMGLLGQPAHPRVRSLIGESMRRVRAAGKAPGIICGDSELAKYYIDCGACFVALGVDASILSGALDSIARRWKG